MFRIRVLTPPTSNAAGGSEVLSELCVGNERFRFVIDLTHWSLADYERQWREGVQRILHGATSSALMTAYAGPDGHMHHMWGLWRDEDYMYVQQHAVIDGDPDFPFDPDDPYSHVGSRIATSKYELPIPEWRVDLISVYAAAMGIKWPLFPFAA